MAEAEPIELDFLAVGAHPDDVEIACGGTLAMLARKGYKVGIVDLTDGEPTPLSAGPDVRAKEADRAAEILGVALRINLNLPNRRLFDSFEHRLALAKVFRKHRPKVVVGFGGKTVMASPDHYQAMLITDAGRLLQPIDEVGRALRRPAGPHGPEPAQLPDRPARPGPARVLGGGHRRHRGHSGGEAGGDPGLPHAISHAEGARVRGGRGDESVPRIDRRVRGRGDLPDVPLHRGWRT
jgi:hypothetical protein